jgi:phosphoadenosine phosphosulfate reductase
LLRNSEAVPSLLERIVDKYTPERTVLSCSFGAPEGILLLDMLTKIVGSSLHVVTIDTGRLPQQTHSFIDRVREKYAFELTVLYPDVVELHDLVTSRGMNCFYDSVGNRRKCCHARKITPFDKFISEHDITANITGLRRGQSIERANTAMIALDKRTNVTKISPLVHWSSGDVESYVRMHSVPTNPLHEQGYESVGCSPCSRPGKGREGRWWWENDETKECGLHYEKGSGI